MALERGSGGWPSKAIGTGRASPGVKSSEDAMAVRTPIIAALLRDSLFFHIRFPKKGLFRGEKNLVTARPAPDLHLSQSTHVPLST